MVNTLENGMQISKRRFLFWLAVLLLASSVVACESGNSPPPPPSQPPPAPEQPQVKPPVIVALEVSPAKVTVVEPVTLRWEVTGANTVIIEPDIGQVPSSGTKKLISSKSIVYKLTATNAGGSVTRTAAVTVYENANASQIALNEDDVKQARFVYHQNFEPKIDDTVSTYSVKFVRRGYIMGKDEILDNTISIHNTVAAAEKRYIEIKANAKDIMAGIATIGDEGYVVKILGGDASDPTTYIIRFRKNNVYVNLGTLTTTRELESFARLVESRIK